MDFGVWNYLFIIVGAVALIFGIYLMVKRPPNKSKIKQYTLESLQKYAFIEGITYITTGIGLVMAGIAYGTEVSQIIMYVGLAIIVLSLIFDFIVEKKIIEPIKKEEKK